MLKKIVLGVVALLGVLVLGAVLLVSLVDVNQYKPQIEQAVKDKTRRTLKIDGDLKLSVFPRLALELPRTTLSNLAGDRPAAGLQSARVSVALLPLLSQRLEIDRVRIDGLTATVERRKDGTTSIDDLIRPDAGQQKQGPAKAGGVPQFDIGGVELTNADLTFADGQSGNTLRLQKLNLRTGRLAPQTRTDVALTGELSSAKPAASVAIDAKGSIELDFAKGAYAAAGLQATAKGTLDKQPLDASARAARLAIDPSTNRLQVQALEAALKGRFGGEDADVQVTAPQLEVAADRAAGERLLVTFRTSGAARQANGRLAAEGISGNASQLQVGKVALDATLQQGARRTVATLAGPARASMEAQTLSLPQLAGTVTLDDPALPQKSLKLPVSGSVELDMKKETVAAKLATTADDTKLDARVNVAGFGAPRIAFDLNADRLNLDTWLPPEAGTAPAGAPASTPAKGSAPKAADPPLDLSALKSLTLNGEARVGQFQARGVKLANLRAVVKAAGGRLDVAPLNAQLYGGSMTASASAQAAGNRLGIDASLANVAIEPLLKDALDKDLLAGRGNVKLAVAGAGATVGALKRSLDGNAALQLRDGSIKGINLAQKLRDAQSLLSIASGGRTDTHASSSTEKTDFSELSASFVIRDGVATNNDLDAKSPLLRLSGAGKIDLGAGTIDYLARVSIVGTLTGQDGRGLDQLRGVTVPVRLSGPFTQLSYGIDYGGVARDALKSRLTEQLQQRLGGGGQNPPQSPSTPDKPASSRDKARDLLKGLLGK